MKKSFKMIYLLIFIFFLTGCGWEDVQKEYGDLLNTEPVCTYYKDDADTEFFGINSLELSANYKGVYASINNGGSQTLFGESNANNFVITPSGIQIQFLDSFFKDFLEQYKNRENNCPERIYIPRDTGYQVRMNDCTDMGYYCDAYTLKMPTVTIPDNDDSNTSKSCYCIPGTDTCGLYRNPRGEYTEHSDMSKCTLSSDEEDDDVILKDCHYSLAIDCLKVVKSDDQFGNEVFLEFGYYTINGVTKKYFGAAGDENYNGFIYDDNEDDGFLLKHNVEYYEVPTQEAIDEIWLPNNKFISKDNIVIKASVTGFDTKYIITGSNSDNYGDWDNTGEIEDAPNIDPDNTDVNINMMPIKPDELDCNSLLGNPDIQGQPAFYLQIVFDVMKYVAIIIVIVFSILDFTGAVASQDNDILKKSVKKLMIRLILCVVIFVLPTILEFIFTLINIYSPSTCGIN